MRGLAAAFAVLALLAPGTDAAAPGRAVTLALPHAPAANQDVVLRVRAGFLKRGMAIDVYDAGGKLLGTVSPFAIRGHREAGTYSIPLGHAPPHRLRLRLVLTEFGEEPRAPTAQELRGVTVQFIDVTN